MGDGTEIIWRSVPLASFLAVVVEYSLQPSAGCTMRILLSALSLLLLLSGCATADREQVALESVVADAAAWNPCTGYADKKLINPVEQIREAIQNQDAEGLEKGHSKLAEILGKVDHLNPLEKFIDIYFNRGEISGRRAMANKMAADVVMHELMRPGSTRAPGAQEMSNLGLIEPHELLPHQMQDTQVSRTIPNAGFQFDPSGNVSMTPATSMGTQSAIDPKARLTPLQQETIKSRRKALQTGLTYRAGVALCPQARLTRFQTKVWTGEQEAQETKSNQRDETSDFSQTQSDQQQYSVFQRSQQLIPIPGGRALLGPITPNAYGPGLNSDAAGRPFMWAPQSGGSGYPDPTLRVQPNAYGLGTGMDQYGRPVRPACPPGMLC